MVFSGVMELGHDLLHHLATHHHVHLHDHSHHTHHGINDHGYATKGPASQIENETSEDRLPSLINFFVYLQSFDSFAFGDVLFARVPPANSMAFSSVAFPPLVPPPWNREGSRI